MWFVSKVFFLDLGTLFKYIYTKIIVFVVSIYLF
jgi:hypothetical protein